MTSNRGDPVCSVLVVDDDPNIVAATKRVLESANFTVSVATNARDGIALAGKQDFALIFSDNIMPEMHGLEFLTIMMKQSPRSRRILVTGYTDHDQAINAFNHRILHRYVQKPWESPTLLAVANEEAKSFAQAMAEDRAIAESDGNLKKRTDMLLQAAELLRRATELEGTNGTGQGPARRLAVILMGDVVGFSRLMGLNHELTLKSLTICRDVLSHSVAQYHGRIVNTVGDSVLAEFQSAVDAVTCAQEIQIKFGLRNASLSVADRMEFRFGINVGDVLTSEGDLYGDGVNVAARVQALAEPGGICITDTVYNHVKARLPYEFQSLGAKELKNIAQPVNIYAVIRKLKSAAGPKVTQETDDAIVKKPVGLQI